MLRLGVNIDHVATVRNARGSGYPDPVRAALIAAEAGADGITAHLREDRRHITDEDIARLSAELPVPLNLEMAATDEMLAIALRHKPHAACIVPEKREERTTEGGLDAAGQHNHLAYYVDTLGSANIRVSLFIEPDERQVAAAIALGAPVVEFHTGRFAHADGEERAAELQRIADCAGLAAKNGIEPHAGHGLTFDNVAPIAAIPQLAELNIGHFLIGEAIYTGLEDSVRRINQLGYFKNLEGKLDTKELKTWFEPTRQLAFDGRAGSPSLRVAVPSRLFADWIETRHGELLSKEAAAAGFPGLAIEIGQSVGKRKIRPEDPVTAMRRLEG